MVNANAFGAVLLPVSVPTQVAGMDVWLQAYDAYAGAFTNALHLIVQP